MQSGRVSKEPHNQKQRLGCLRRLNSVASNLAENSPKIVAGDFSLKGANNGEIDSKKEEGKNLSLRSQHQEGESQKSESLFISETESENTSQSAIEKKESEKTRHFEQRRKIDDPKDKLSPKKDGTGKALAQEYAR